MSTSLITLDGPENLAAREASPPAFFLKEAERFWDFFTANIRNPHTRRAYYNAVCKFSQFCAERGVHLEHVKPEHVAAYVESHAGTLEYAHVMAATPPRARPSSTTGAMMKRCWKSTKK